MRAAISLAVVILLLLGLFHAEIFRVYYAKWNLYSRQLKRARQVEKRQWKLFGCCQPEQGSIKSIPVKSAIGGTKFSARSNYALHLPFNELK